MGWTSLHRDKGQSNREFFETEFPGLRTEATILADATVGGTYYAAVRDDGNGKVWAMVVLTRWAPKSDYNFTYKFLDETMGPAEAKAPAKILDLLTPTDVEYAIEWRARCRKNLERVAKLKTVKVGDIVHFVQPISFGVYGTFEEMQLVDKRRSQFRAPNGLHWSDTLYRFPGWRDVAAVA